MPNHKTVSTFERSGPARFALPALLGLFWLSGCSARHAAQSKAPHAATVTNAPKESDLATLKLTPEAEKRLGIETAAVEFQAVARTLDLSGEVVVPPGQTIVVSAPLAGTLQAPAQGALPAAGGFVRKGQSLFRLAPFLTPERDLGVQLERDVNSLTERVAAAKLRKERADQLVEEKAGSVRAAEQAREELAVAGTELAAARERLERFTGAPLSSDLEVAITAPISGRIQRVSAQTGQTIAGGAALLEIVGLSNLWIRVPVYVGDLPSVARNQAARIHGLGDAQGAPVRLAKPVNAPPTANPLNDTADLYFELANGDGSLRPGQRVGVTLRDRSSEQSLVAPWSAVLHDTSGGTWVYENIAPQQYARRRVEVRRVVDKLAALGRGPAVGAKVVTAGAAELFGTEFGTGK